MEVTPEPFTEKIDVDLKILSNIWNISALEGIDKTRIAFLSLFFGACDDTLLADNASKIFALALKYESSRFRPGIYFDQLDAALKRCLKQLSASQTEGAFLVFLHDFGQSWNNGNGSMEPIVALRALKIYSQLVPSLVIAHAAKLLPVLSEAFGRPGVGTLKEDLVDASKILLAIPLLPEYLKCVLQIGLSLIEPSSQLPGKFDHLLDELPVSLLLRFVQKKFIDSGKKFAQISSEHITMYRMIVKRAINSAGLEAEDRLRAHELLVSLGTDIDVSVFLHWTMATSEVQNVCCYSQLHMIRFAVHHLKTLLKSISLEADISKRNSLAFTIQKLCRFLNLNSEKSEVWDAFDLAQRTLIEPFLSSKYRFEFELSSHSVPIILKASDLPDWMSSMFCQINSLFDFDPEVQSFMNTFAAIILYDGASHFDILAAFIISALIRIESFAVTLSQEYTVNPCMNFELSLVKFSSRHFVLTVFLEIASIV